MLPKQIRSLWTATTPKTDYPEIKAGLDVDVAIVGGGIAGLNAGYFLARGGFRIAVIDSGHIATGTSGNTTAKITSQHGLKYAYIKNEFGFEKAKIYADANQWAITEAENIIRDEKIDCEFTKMPAHVYSMTDEGLWEIKQEVNVAQELGLPASFVEDIPNIPFAISGAIKFENQAYFHPRKYLLALAKIIRKKGGYIFENTNVLQTIEKENHLVVTSTCNVSAKHIIIATNCPLNKAKDTENLSHLYKARSYALATKLNQPLPDGMFIAIDGNHLSFRPHRIGSDEWFLIGGESHDIERDEDIDHFAKLQQLASENFDIKKIGYKWAAEDTMTEDMLPYIGRIPQTKNIFVTTGYNKWGMTTSFVSAKILTDLIAGKSNPWAELYGPTRTPSNFFTEFQHTITTDIDKLFPDKEESDNMDFPDLMPDQGKVISKNNQKIAIYKDTNGTIHTYSATCTHLGCTVSWNNKEKTWDCPCHGSRFNKEGTVLNGPAQKALHKAKVNNS